MTFDRPNQWRPPRRYKSVKEVESDFGEALKKVAEGIMMMQGIATKFNETNPGQGDILYGASAVIREAVDSIIKIAPEIKSVLSGEPIKSFKARHFIKMAERKAPSASIRRQIKNRGDSRRIN